MKRRLLKKVIVFMAVIFCQYGIVYGAGIAIEPTRIEVQAKAGDIASGKWNVENRGNKPADFKVVLEDWLKRGVNPEDWIKIENKQFNLGPQENINIDYVIFVPKDAVGELMTMVFFNALEGDSKIGTGFGIPVYVIVAGSEVVDAGIAGLNIEYVTEKGLTGYVEIENKGNVHIRPNILISVSTVDGKGIKYFGLPSDIPTHVGQKRRYCFTKMVQELEPGVYVISITVNYGKLYGIEKTITKREEFEIGNIINNEEEKDVSEM